MPQLWSRNKKNQRHKNQKLLEAINAAYDDVPDVKEESLKSMTRSRHLEMVKDQW
jgi:hypothetical protein